MKNAETIWQEYQQQLAAFIRKRVPGNVVEDLLQDVFLKIHTRLDSLKDDTRLEGWLYQMTRRAVIDYYRSNRPTDALPEWLELPQVDAEETVRRDLTACLAPMIKRLPDTYRDAVQLSEVEGKTQKDVAEALGISLSGAKSRIQRGRALLKAMLHECCHIEVSRHNQLLSYEKKNADLDCDCDCS